MEINISQFISKYQFQSGMVEQCTERPPSLSILYCVQTKREDDDILSRKKRTATFDAAATTAPPSTCVTSAVLLPTFTIPT